MMKGASGGSGSQECISYSNKAQAAVDARDWKSATESIKAASGICEGKSLVALQGLEKQIATGAEHAKTLSVLCGETESKALDFLVGKHAGKAVNLLDSNRQSCLDSASYVDTLQKAESVVTDAKKLLFKSREKLIAMQVEEAGQLFDKALLLDVDVDGADTLRQEITQVRAQQQTSANVAATAQPTSQPRAKLQPVASQTVAESVVSNAQLQPDISELAKDMLDEAKRSLQEKDYAAAKNFARSALRMAPNNAEAHRVLKQAESAEQKAFSEMSIQ